MKKILLVFLMFLAFGITKAQLVLTPNGLRSSNDTTKSFVILDVPNKSKVKLYNETLSTVIKSILTDSKRRNVDTVRATSIHLSGETEPSSISKGGLPFYWKYGITYSFKDNKIRFELDKLIFEAKGSGGELFKIQNLSRKSTKYLTVFNSKNEVVNNEAKENIENFANSIINKTLEGIKEWDNW